MLFLPDQHLGRNTAVLKMGDPARRVVVWDPQQPGGGLTAEELQRRSDHPVEGPLLRARRFSEDVVDELRAKHPGVKILVHPECTHEVVPPADLVGSTEFIIKTIEAAPAAPVWAIGTELNLVQRLQGRPPRQDDRLPRPQRLLLLDDEPDRPPAPGLGPGEPCRRQRRQPDHRRSRDRGRRPGGAAADARPAGQVAPRPETADRTRPGRRQ